ncbi:hypothetical protein BaRGS_00027539, partial [Batillaria attramentaria]
CFCKTAAAGKIRGKLHRLETLVLTWRTPCVYDKAHGMYVSRRKGWGSPHGFVAKMLKRFYSVAARSECTASHINAHSSNTCSGEFS